MVNVEDDVEDTCSLYCPKQMLSCLDAAGSYAKQLSGSMPDRIGAACSSRQRPKQASSRSIEDDIEDCTTTIRYC